MTRDFLLIRLDAPLMSFGGVKVDKRGVTADFPALSMVAGLLGNALGYDHRDVGLLRALQERVRFAVRRDRVGERVVDYQTVDLGQDHLKEDGWTTRGVPEGRRGGEAREGTHIRLREFWADSVFTLALVLEPAAEAPTLDDLARALESPERPLFLGRKPCLPASPLLLGRLRAPSLSDALARYPRLPERRSDPACPLTAWLPVEEAFAGPSREIPVFDERDWANQIVVGRRLVKQVTLPMMEVKDEG